MVPTVARRNHDTANIQDTNLAARCQRCHMLRNRDKHQSCHWLTLFRRKAMGDMYRDATDLPQLGRADSITPVAAPGQNVRNGTFISAKVAMAEERGEEHVRQPTRSGAPEGAR